MIHATLDGPLWVVTLSRPDRRNALTPDMAGALLGAIESVPPPARAILLRGEGAVFCSGFDLKLCLDHPGTLESLLRILSDMIAHMRLACTRPIIIAAHGAAIAGACAILGGADIIITDAAAKLGYPVVPLGISPAVSAPFLRRCITNGAARRRLLDPALMSGTEAHAIGLAHECLPTPDLVLPRAREIALELAAKPPGALAATRAWLAEIESIPDEPTRALAASLSIVESQEQRNALAHLFKAKS